MGCGIGKPSLFTGVYTLYPELTAFRPQFEKLLLKEPEIGMLYKLYTAVDVDRSGEISYEELLVHIDVENTPFSKRIFTIFDEDGSGQISFHEFVLTLWNYCTLGKSTLVMFAFDLYDRDTSGFIEKAELLQLLKEIYGREYQSNLNCRNLLQEIDQKGVELGLDGSIGVNTFREYCKKRPALLFPAFQMQTSLRKKALGGAFWEKYSAVRLELSNGEYMSIAQLIELNVHDKKRDQFILKQRSSGIQMNEHAVELVEKSGLLSKRSPSEKSFVPSRSPQQSSQVAGKNILLSSGSKKELAPRVAGDQSSITHVGSSSPVATTSGKGKLKLATNTVVAMQHIKPKPGVSEKVPSKSTAGFDTPPLRRNQSAKSVKFSVETTIHAPDRTMSGKLKATSNHVAAANKMSKARIAVT